MKKFRGVCKVKGCNGYVVTIGKKRYIGYFLSFEDAIEARKKAEIDYYGRLLEKLPIEINGNVARIPLYGRGCKLHGWTEIDISDLDKVKDTKWTLSKTGYVVGKPSGSKNVIKMHRYILSGIDSGKIIDHIDRNPLNNRRENLRICTQLDNAKNLSVGKNNRYGFKGIRPVNNKWAARIMVNRKEINLGRFKTKEEAALAYNKGALKYHGDFASLNVV